MPTIKRIGPYRFFFYSHEPNEPPHVHVERDDSEAKYWLHDCALARSVGFGAKELNVIQSHIQDNRTLFLQAWHDFFGV